jgi:hypothetical protein
MDAGGKLNTYSRKDIMQEDPLKKKLVFYSRKDRVIGFFLYM